MQLFDNIKKLKFSVPRSVDGSQSGNGSQPFYVFRPDVFPSHRQFFYQLCDIQVEEVKAMVREVQLQSQCSV